MAINGSIAPGDLQAHSAEIIRKLGFKAYARCWLEVMILHRHTQFLECVFACLDAEPLATGERLDAQPHARF